MRMILRCLKDLLHSEETQVWGDSAYSDQKVVIREHAPRVRDFTQQRRVLRICQDHDPEILSAGIFQFAFDSCRRNVAFDRRRQFVGKTRHFAKTLNPGGKHRFRGLKTFDQPFVQQIADPRYTFKNEPREQILHRMLTWWYCPGRTISDNSPVEGFYPLRFCHARRIGLAT